MQQELLKILMQETALNQYFTRPQHVNKSPTSCAYIELDVQVAIILGSQMCFFSIQKAGETNYSKMGTRHTGTDSSVDGSANDQAAVSAVTEQQGANEEMNITSELTSEEENVVLRAQLDGAMKQVFLLKKVTSPRMKE